MLVWSSIETSCPMCQSRLEVREVGGGCVVGQDSDLLLRMHGDHIIEAEIHCCPKCLFSGSAADFTGTDVSPEDVTRFAEETQPQLADVLEARPAREKSFDAKITVWPHQQYHLSALAADFLGLPAREIGLRMVRAYWCLRLAPGSHLPKRTLARLRKTYLNQAIAFLRKSLRHETDPSFTYLVAELCRRNGNFIRAQNYFSRYLERSGTPEYLRDAARRLAQLARDGDSSHRRLEELLYEDPSSRRRRSSRSKESRGRRTDRDA